MNNTETDITPATLGAMGYFAATHDLIELPEFKALRIGWGDHHKVTYGYMKAPFVLLKPELTYEQAKAKLRKLIIKAEAVLAKDNARAAKEKEERAAEAVKEKAAATTWRGMLRAARGGPADTVLPEVLRYRAFKIPQLMRAGEDALFTLRLPADLGERALLLARIDDLMAAIPA
jgi:hypothetical protein